MVLAKVALIALSLAFLLNSSVLGFSQQTTSKETTEVEKSQNNFYLELDRRRCRDSYKYCKEEMCYSQKKYYKRKVKRQCKKTCGHCRALSPPTCFSSPYGCCWDYMTNALGPGGKGCPPCQDNPRYPFVCSRFQTYCRRTGKSGKWMRINCPNSCGHCAIWQF